MNGKVPHGPLPRGENWARQLAEQWGEMPVPQAIVDSESSIPSAITSAKKAIDKTNKPTIANLPSKSFANSFAKKPPRGGAQSTINKILETTSPPTSNGNITTANSVLVIDVDTPVSEQLKKISDTIIQYKHKKRILSILLVERLLLIIFFTRKSLKKFVSRIYRIYSRFYSKVKKIKIKRIFNNFIVKILGRTISSGFYLGRRLTLSNY